MPIKFGALATRGDHEDPVEVVTGFCGRNEKETRRTLTMSPPLEERTCSTVSQAATRRTSFLLLLILPLLSVVLLLRIRAILYQWITLRSVSMMMPLGYASVTLN